MFTFLHQIEGQHCNRHPLFCNLDFTLLFTLQFWSFTITWYKFNIYSLFCTTLSFSVVLWIVDMRWFYNRHLATGSAGIWRGQNYETHTGLPYPHSTILEYKMCYLNNHSNCYHDEIHIAIIKLVFVRTGTSSISVVQHLWHKISARWGGWPWPFYGIEKMAIMSLWEITFITWQLKWWT